MRTLLAAAVLSCTATCSAAATNPFLDPVLANADVRSATA